MSNIATNPFNGFTGNLNELVQAYFSNPTYFDASTYSTMPDSMKWNYIYGGLLRAAGPQILKLSNMQNYLSEWERGGTYGGFVQNIAFEYARPMDPPSFAQYSDPGNGMIVKTDLDVTYHPFTVHLEVFRTQFANQVRDAMRGVDEMANFLTGFFDSINSGFNASLFWVFKELFFKHYTDMPAAQRTALTIDTLPADITSRDEAIQALNIITGYADEFLFGAPYNARNYTHVVQYPRMRLMIDKAYARKITNFLTLTHFRTETDGSGGLMYGNTAVNISGFTQIPTRILDDFGGQVPYAAPTTPGDPSTSVRLYPKFDAEGAILGTFSSTAGGTDTVEVDHWGPSLVGYAPKAILTEDDFGNVFTINDTVQSMEFIRGGGYSNTSRYCEKILAPKPQSNTLYFM